MEKQDEQKNMMSKKKTVIIGSSLLAVFLIAVVFITVKFSERSREDTVYEYFESLTNNDIDKFSDVCFSSDIMYAYCTLMELEKDEVLTQYYANIAKDKTEYKDPKIISETRVSDEEMNELVEQMEKDSKVDINIEEMYRTNVNVQIKEDDVWEEKEITLVLYLSGREWYIYPI